MNETLLRAVMQVGCLLFFTRHFYSVLFFLNDMFLLLLSLELIILPHSVHMLNCDNLAFDIFYHHRW